MVILTPERGIRVSPRRPRVLLVDDETAVLRALSRALARWFDVVPCTDARSALDMLAGGACFDAIVTDVVMPGLDGLGFYRAVSTDFEALAPRVVFFTSEAPSGLVPPARWLMKPAPIETLREAILAAVRTGPT